MGKISFVFVWGVIVLPTLSGCATIGAYLERSTRKEPIVSVKHANDPVAGVSLSAARRQIISAKLPNGKWFTCSEPPPDAGVAQYIKDSLNITGKADLSSEQNFSILALSRRTELVEFWRTTSFNYCLLLMNESYAPSPPTAIDGKGGSASATYLAAAKEILTNYGKTPDHTAANSDAADHVTYKPEPKPTAEPTN